MSSIKPLFGGFTRDDWAGYFAPEANRRVRDWIVGWTTHEISVLDQPDCQGYNLLNTHLGCEGGGGPDAMCCRGDQGHIRRFASVQEGAEGNRSVIQENHPGYAAIEAAIKGNDINALLTSADVRLGLYTWVGFHTYDYLAPLFEGQGALHRYDTFLYGGTQPPAPPSPPGTGGTTPNTTGTGTGTATSVGSCRWCLLGLPGACPTDEVCAQLNSDGTVYEPAAVPGVSGTCISNSYATANVSPDGQHGPAVDSPTVCENLNSGKTKPPPSPTGTAGTLAQDTAQLLNFINNPQSWQRVAKVVLGGALILAALGLAGYVLVEKIPGVGTGVQAAVKQAKKVKVLA